MCVFVYYEYILHSTALTTGCLRSVLQVLSYDAKLQVLFIN